MAKHYSKERFLLKTEVSISNMPDEKSLEEFQNGAFELEAAAELFDPFVFRLDAFLAYIDAKGPNWSFSSIPKEHEISIDDMYSVHQNGERSFLKYLHLYPTSRPEWISGTLLQFKMTTVEGQRAVLNEKRNVLRKFAGLLRGKANLPPRSQTHLPTIHHHHGDVIMRDSYKDFVSAAVGPNSASHDTTIQVWKRAASELDLPGLGKSLSLLRSSLKSADPDGDHDEEIGKIASAEKAAKKGDGKTALKHLRDAGDWVLGIAAKVGETVAAKAIEDAIGLPSE